MEEYKIKYEMLSKYLTTLINDKGYINTEDVRLILKVLGEEYDK